MSIHPSLRGADTLTGERSVFTRIERLQRLLKEGKRQEGESPFGLPKVRTRFKVVKKKLAPEAEAPAAPEAPAEIADEGAAKGKAKGKAKESK